MTGDGLGGVNVVTFYFRRRQNKPVTEFVARDYGRIYLCNYFIIGYNMISNISWCGVVTRTDMMFWRTSVHPYSLLINDCVYCHSSTGAQVDSQRR